MSPILINSANVSNIIPKSNFVDEEKEEEDNEKAREERKATGRSIAIVIFLALMCLALYHVIQRKTTILAGVLVPALILFAYTFFVIHISNRDKKRRKQLEATELAELERSIPNNDILNLELSKNLASTSNLSNIKPSTSSKQFSSSNSLAATKIISSNIKPNSSSKSKTPNDIIAPASKSTDLKKIPHTVKKTSLQQQVKPNQSAQIVIENEMKKIKKSRSHDKNNHTETRHAKDNKKIKTKH